MKIIDTFTGKEVKLGDRVPDPQGGFWELLDVQDRGFFDASILIRGSGLRGGLQTEHWVPLQVRLMHPKYLFQRVGFTAT